MQDILTELSDLQDAAGIACEAIEAVMWNTGIPESSRQDLVTAHDSLVAILYPS